MKNERTVSVGNRMFGFLGPRASVTTFAWLALHRDRLKTLIVGGTRLSLILVYDQGGKGSVMPVSEAEEKAIRTIVNGEKI